MEKRERIIELLGLEMEWDQELAERNEVLISQLIEVDFGDLAFTDEIGIRVPDHDEWIHLSKLGVSYVPMYKVYSLRENKGFTQEELEQTFSTLEEAKECANELFEGLARHDQKRASYEVRSSYNHNDYNVDYFINFEKLENTTDEEKAIKLATEFIEKYDLDHGNSEIFIQDDNLYMVVEAPDNWTTLLEIPIDNVSEESIIDAFIVRINELDVDDYFDELWGSVPEFTPSQFMRMLQDDLKFYENVVDKIREHY